MPQFSPPPGSIGWLDLTVPDAEPVAAFYEAVVGWSRGEVDMGDYADYTMHAPGESDPIAGVCHAKGPNADIPVGWLPYFVVEDLSASVATAEANGGTLIARQAAGFAVVRDPAGAVFCLYEPPTDDESPAS